MTVNIITFDFCIGDKFSTVTDVVASVVIAPISSADATTIGLNVEPGSKTFRIRSNCTISHSEHLIFLPLSWISALRPYTCRLIIRIREVKSWLLAIA